MNGIIFLTLRVSGISMPDLEIYTHPNDDITAGSAHQLLSANTIEERCLRHRFSGLCAVHPPFTPPVRNCFFCACAKFYSGSGASGSLTLHLLGLVTDMIEHTISWLHSVYVFGLLYFLIFIYFCISICLRIICTDYYFYIFIFFIVFVFL